MIRPAPAAVPIHYPSSDGKPMAENDAQRDAIMYGVGALTHHFKGRRDVYVSGDLLIYYEEGNPRVSVAPDVFVVFGVESRQRLNYKLWEEGRAPAFVLEVASPSTWRDDLGWKRSVYARLGVREYWQYDPAGEHLPARLQGERLTRSGYVRQPAATAADGTLTLRSETLGLSCGRRRAGRCASGTRRRAATCAATTRKPRGAWSPKRAPPRPKHALPRPKRGWQNSKPAFASGPADGRVPSPAARKPRLEHIDARGQGILQRGVGRSQQHREAAQRVEIVEPRHGGTTWPIVLPRRAARRLARCVLRLLLGRPGVETAAQRVVAWLQPCAPLRRPAKAQR